MIELLAAQWACLLFAWSLPSRLGCCRMLLYIVVIFLGVACLALYFQRIVEVSR